MIKSLTVIALTSLICFQAVPAFCATFTITVIMPPHIMSSVNPNMNTPSINPDQFIQTQIVLRDNQRITLTSVVIA